MKASVWILFFLVSLRVVPATALTLPQNLNAEDRKNVLAVLGYGSKSKILSSPVPLGGSEGFEVGISTEFIPVADLGGYGTGGGDQSELQYRNLVLGKGLVYNIDTYLHLTPLPQDDGVFGYGAQVRWGFWEARRFPALLSLIVHGSGMNYSNRLSTRTTGADLIMTISMDQVALYFGGGSLRTIGTFSGGPEGLTLEGDTRGEDLTGIHSIFGLSIGYRRFALALEIDRVEQSSYAARLNYRF